MILHLQKKHKGFFLHDLSLSIQVWGLPRKKKTESEARCMQFVSDMAKLAHEECCTRHHGSSRVRPPDFGAKTCSRVVQFTCWQKDMGKHGKCRRQLRHALSHRSFRNQHVTGNEPSNQRRRWFCAFLKKSMASLSRTLQKKMQISRRVWKLVYNHHNDSWGYLDISGISTEMSHGVK